MRMQKLCHSVREREGEEQTQGETVARVPGWARRTREERRDFWDTHTRGTLEYSNLTERQSPRRRETNDGN